MSEKKQYIPELRFPEFKAEEIWKKKRLGDVFDFYSGGTPSTTNKSFYGGTIPFIRSAEIDKKNTELFLTEKGLINSSAKLVEEGDLLIALYGANSGEVAISKIHGAINQAILCLKSDYSNEFAFYSFSNNKKKIISKYLQGGQGNLSGKIVTNIKLYFPTKDEQQKIADCLSSLDRLITLEKEKLDALKDHKKGLLQSLFPAKGKKIPERRFPEFEKDGEWKEIRFDKMFDLLVTNSFSRAKLNYKKGKIKNIHYGDIHTQFSILFDIEKENVPFINENISVDKLKEETFCKEGDLIFADASEDIDDIGKVIEIVSLNNEKLVSGLHTIHARQKELKMIVGFGAYLFSSETIKDKIRREAQGAKVLGLSKKGISRIKFLYPQNKKEQENILNVLSSVDKLIKNQGDKIEQLREHKNGLMQRLFPKM